MFYGVIDNNKMLYCWQENPVKRRACSAPLRRRDELTHKRGCATFHRFIFTHPYTQSRIFHSGFFVFVGFRFMSFLVEDVTKHKSEKAENHWFFNPKSSNRMIYIYSIKISSHDLLHIVAVYDFSHKLCQKRLQCSILKGEVLASLYLIWKTGL